MTAATAPRRKLRREDFPKGTNLCEHCTAKCCRYFALPIETPTELDDFNNIRWYLLHGRAAVFVEDGDWYLMVYADCKHLLPDNRCGIYEQRPGICRAYTTDDCEFEDDALYDQFFETPEQVWEYAEVICGPHEPMRKFSPVPPPVQDVALPVIS
jgi:uncharacterized protein